MIVLLLRVPPGTQGTNAPMGGTGWLVSTYALDPAGGSSAGILGRRAFKSVSSAIDKRQSLMLL
jgi:hypothetical protein